MSKSRGNVVNPDEIVNEFGADTLRMYEMFMGPLESTKPWNVSGVEGIYRYLARVWRLFVGDDGQLNPKIAADANPGDAFMRVWHRSVKKITEDYEALRFNTAISQTMIFVNEAYKTEQLPLAAMKDLAQLMAPLAPHLGEELWERLGGRESLTYAAWPTYEESWTVDNEVEIVVQINGKIVERIMIAADTEQAEMEKLAFASDKVKEATAGKAVRKVIVVKGKLVNIVAK
jgi:leucyl-tRNA synthetase